MAITNITVTIAGQVGDGTTTLEVDGTAVPIAGDQTFNAEVSVPEGTRNIPVTTIDARGRRRTRTVQIGHRSVVGAQS